MSETAPSDTSEMYVHRRSCVKRNKQKPVLIGIIVRPREHRMDVKLSRIIRFEIWSKNKESNGVVRMILIAFCSCTFILY
jgi:hypothetical protein